MALRGTLQDFGIADIFQLIGHQGKSGVLRVVDKQRDVHVHFCNGDVVRASTTTPREKHLLGQMLVRAEVLSQEQLDEALQVHRQSGRRIGDVLVESKLVDRAMVSLFCRLQIREMIYQLFLWVDGSYEFNSEEVTVYEDEEPLRTDTVLMEGFRQVDEWRWIRRRVNSYGMKFEVLVDLESLEEPVPEVEDEKDHDDIDFDAAFGAVQPSNTTDSSKLTALGPKERQILKLLGPDKDVQNLIDLSRLGEFETCKALGVLIDKHIIRQVTQVRTATLRHGALDEGVSSRMRLIISQALAGFIIVAGAATAVLIGAPHAGFSGSALGRVPSQGYQPQALKRELGRARIVLLERGLEAYRARFGRYPDHLEALIPLRWISPSDLKFPWQEAYSYEGGRDSYRLLRPLE